MRAIVKTAPGENHLELKDLAEPSAGPTDVKMKVAAAGICGTDIHIIKGERPCCPPVVLGHEFCGTVVAVGLQVRSLKPGDRIIASNPARTCGMCSHCLAGNPFLCAHRISAGYMIDGGFAEYLCIASERCHILPDNVSFRQAALGEPLSVAVHAVVERSIICPGDVVLVSGPGCIGLLAMQIAKLRGAHVIVAGTAKDERRLSLAADLGADVVIDASREDVLGIVQSHSRDAGPDIVYECAGATSSLAMCFEAVKRGGTIVLLGIHPGPLQIDVNKVTMKELSVIGSYGYLWTSWQRTIHLLSMRKVKTEELISHEFPLERYEDAFRAAQDGSATKVIFVLA